MKKRFLKAFIVFIILLLSFSGCGLKKDLHNRKITSENVTTISFIDVGQGDSTLIEFENGEVMLIDSSEKEYGDDIENILD